MKSNYLHILIAVVVLTVGATPRLRSPRDKAQMQNAPMRRVAAAATTVEQVILSWKYPLPMPQPNIIFDIEYRESMRTGSWVKVGQTTVPPFSYMFSAPSKKSGFFQVVTRSTGTNQSVSLAWDPPSPVTGIIGYHVHYGPSSGHYTQYDNVSGAATTSKTISNITARTFFVATTIDVSSLESDYSNEVDYTPQPVYPVTSLTITKL